MSKAILVTRTFAFVAVIVFCTTSHAQTKSTTSTKMTSKSTSTKAIKLTGRLPRYFAAIVDNEQRQEIYQIQANYAKEIDELEKKLEALKAKETSEIEKVLTSTQQKKLATYRENGLPKTTRKSTSTRSSSTKSSASAKADSTKKTASSAKKSSK